MTAIERLADLKEHLDHLERILAERTVDVASLESDRSLHNDVMFALLMACQAVRGLGDHRSAAVPCPPMRGGPAGAGIDAQE